MRRLVASSAIVLCLSITFAQAAPATADVAIDCSSKRLSGVEQRICNSKELRALDSKMAESFIWAHSAVSQPQDLQRIHRDWAARRDQQGGYLPTAYKIHTKWLEQLVKGSRLDTRLGRYAYSTCPDMLDADSDKPRSCGKPFENELTLTPHENGQVKVVIDSMFMYGHSCSYEGTGTWKSPTKLVARDDSELDLKNCYLEVTITGKKAETTLVSKDPSEPCRPMYCGMHGTLDDVFYLGGQPKKK